MKPISGQSWKKKMQTESKAILKTKQKRREGGEAHRELDRLFVHTPMRTTYPAN